MAGGQPLAGGLAGWRAGGLVGRLVGWWVGGLVGRLVGWWVGGLDPVPPPRAPLRIFSHI